MSGRIKYDFAALGDLEGGLNAQFGRLEDLASQLKSQVAALDGNWRSPGAKQAYDAAQQNWDRVFMQAREQLLGREVRYLDRGGLGAPKTRLVHGLEDEMAHRLLERTEDGWLLRGDPAHLVDPVTERLLSPA